MSFLKSEENVFPANLVTLEGVWENIYTHKIWVNGSWFIFSHTPSGVTKFAGKTFSSDLRKLTAVSESLSKFKIIYSGTGDSGVVIGYQVDSLLTHGLQSSLLLIPTFILNSLIRCFH